MTQGKDIEHRRGGAKPGEVSGKRRIGRGGDSRLQRGDGKLAVGLAKRHQPHTGGNQIGGEGR